MHNLLINKIFKKGGILLLGVLFSFSLLLLPHTTEAAMLTPGNIATCGELGVSGEYTLTADLTTSGTSTCFYVSSDNVTINGNGHSITGNGTNNGSIAIDARARVGGPSGILDEGMNGYDNFTINNLIISGFTNGINASGNSSASGQGGNGGDVNISSSTVVNVTSNGGDGIAAGASRGGDVTVSSDSSVVTVTVVGGVSNYSSVSQNAGDKYWWSMTSTPSGDVYAVVPWDDIYKQTGGTGAFVAQGAGNKQWRSITSTANGDVYAAAQFGDIYKQAGGTGDFVEQWAEQKNWYSITFTPSGDMYVVAGGDDIYKQIGGTGDFVAQGAGDKSWRSITSTPNGDVYAVDQLGDIYKQTGGTGAFVAQGAGNRYWQSITSTPSGDMYAVETYGDIYKKGFIYATGGTTNITSSQTGNINTGSGILNIQGTNINLSNKTYTASGGININYSGSLNTSSSTNIFTSTANFNINNTTYKYPSTVASGYNGVYNPSIYYFRNVIDTNWNTLGNWCNVSYCGQVNSTPATTLPTLADQVNVNGDILSNSGPQAQADTVVFNGTSTNSISINAVRGTTFNASSTNTGTTTLPLVNFNDESINTGTIFSTISTFYNNTPSAVLGKFKVSAMGAFVEQGAGNRYWQSITSTPSGDVYAVVSDGKIYKQTGGTGAFVAQGSGNKLWYFITSTPSGDVYAVVNSTSAGGGIYKQTGGTGVWVEQGAGNKAWSSVTSTSNGDVYAVVNSTSAGGGIYKQTGGTGVWVEQGAGNKVWQSITSTPSGDVYAVVGGLDIYKQTGGTGAFVAQGAGDRYWQSITSTPSGDVYAVVNSISAGGGIYKQSAIHPILQRIYNQTATSTRIFASSTESGGEAGHSDWIIIAQRAVGSIIDVVVDLTNATYNLLTNIFKSFTGARFISGTDINGLTTSVVPNVSVSLPTEGQTVTKWLPSIDWGNSTVCKYSYDNFVSSTTVNCANNGTDIVKPSAGLHTLTIRGINQYGSYAENAISFTYDNISPTWTSCGSDLLDEPTRQYYYLASSTADSCTATVDTKLYGNQETTDSTVLGTGFTVNGSFNGNGHNITLKNIAVTGTITSNAGTVTIQNATTSAIDVSATSTGTNGGTVNVSTSTTGTITANGANGINNGGNGGTITISNSDGSTTNTAVTANGGNSTSCGNGGNAGIINITNSDNYSATASVGTGSNNTCQDRVRTSGSVISAPVVVVRPVVIPPSTPTDNTNVNTNTNRGGASSGSLFKKLGKVDLDKLSLKNLPSFSFSGLSSGSSLGTSKFVNPLAGLLQLQPVTGFNPLPRINLLPKLSNFLNSSLPQSLVTLRNSVPSIKKELISAGIKNGYDLYTMKESPINTPTLTQLSKDKTKQPTNLIFVSVDNKETPTKLSIDKKGRAYQILTVAPNSTIDINVKSTGKTLPKTIFDNNSVEASKDKSNNVKLTLNAPAKDGERILMVGDLTLEIRVAKPEAPVQPKPKKELSPIIKMWSWFGK